MLIYCICTQYLVGAPFALITASIRRGMEVISLWHCWGGMEAQVSLTVAFSSSALLGLVSLIFLLTIPHRFSMGFRSGVSSLLSSVENYINLKSRELDSDHCAALRFTLQHCTAVSLNLQWTSIPEEELESIHTCVLPSRSLLFSMGASQ